MPNFTMDVPHNLEQEEAKNRVQGLLEKVREQYQDQVSDLEESWTDNTLSFAFKTYGFDIKGDVNVEPEKVCLQGGLPFAAVAFKGKIEQVIREQLEKVLA